MTRTPALAGAAGVVCAALVLAGCSPSPTSAQQTDAVVTVSAAAGTEPPSDVLAEFTSQTGIRVEVSTAGSDLQLAERVAQGAQPADLALGIPAPNTSAIGESEHLLPYTSTDSGGGSIDFDYVRSNRLTAYSYDYVCAASYAEGDHAAMPSGLSDFVQPDRARALSFPDPRTSSAGLTFLLTANNQSAPKGGDEWRDYWSQLGTGGAHVDAGSSLAGAADADTAVRVVSPSRAGVAADEVIGSTCTRRVRYLGIVAGSAHVNQAKKLIDFLLSDTAQRALPDAGDYPVRTGAPVPDAMRRIRALWEHNGENNTNVAADDTLTPAVLAQWATAFGAD